MWPFKKKAPEPVKAQRKFKPFRKARSYDAASTGRLFESWTTTPTTADEVLRRQLPILRARSRQQAENNDYARRFFTLLKSNVVGPTGVGFQSDVRDFDGTLDKLATDAIEAAFRKWSRPGNCEITGKLSRADCERLFIQSAGMDGEVLVRKVIGKAAGPSMFAVQFIDPEFLDVRYNEVYYPNGNHIRMGIEFSDQMRPVAYHFTVKEASEDTYSYSGNEYERVPADQIIHAFVTERVGQSRGVPWMATALARMQMLDKYEEAAVVASRVGASKMGFFTSTDGEGYSGDDVDGEGNTLTEATPGMFEQLADGTDFKTFDPTYPHQQFADFMKTCLRGISSGLGVAYNGLANDLEGVNFSSIRAGVLEEREVYKSLQEWMIETYCRPIFETWLHVALHTGQITVPTRDGGMRPLNVLREDRYQSARFQARRWSWVDPVKDVQANIMAIEHNLRSYSDIIRDQGRDPDDVWREIQKDRETMQNLGIMDGEEEAATEDGATPQVDESERAKATFDAYGIGVRAGAITPQEDDESHFRALLKVPKPSKPVKTAWKTDGGTRRPITLQSGDQFDAQEPGAAAAASTGDEDETDQG